MVLTRKKCLFIVQGEGRGHMTQSLSMKQILQDAGIEVCEVLIGKSKHREIPSFYYQKIGAKVTPIVSPNMAQDKKGKGIKSITTLLKNIFLLPHFIKSLNTINRKIKEHNPDLIINFYEPLCGLYYLLFHPKIRMVSIAHHYMFLHSDYRMPSGKNFENYFLKFYTRLTTFGATKKLALSFYRFENDEAQSIYVVPPLLRNEVMEQPIENNNFILIYILNSGYMDEIIKWHIKNPETVLHCFTDKKEMADEVKYDDTLYFHQLNDKNFLKLMSNASGVATTAGFESVCEAMYMGKPVFMVPVKGHYEQFCNSRDAFKTSASIYDESFNMSVFLNYIKNYKIENLSFKTWADQSRSTIIKHIQSVMYAESNVRHLYPYKQPYKQTAQ
ncbi:MAG TPA: glycosyltransferase family protein [Bacteroidia bacterium]|nr:glycosyltransferase family protein [Bacteroidia bacterium]